MKITQRIGNYTFELEGQDIKEIWKQLSYIGELFTDRKCGKCGSDNITPNHRVVEDNSYFEMKCHDCSHALAFGQHKKGGTLFPKRKNKDDTWKQNRGWEKYNRPEEDHEEAVPQPPKKEAPSSKSGKPKF